MNTTANPGAQGACEPRFDAVRRVFEEQVASGREVGAAVAVTLDGDPIVDLWGGFADQARTTPWDRDTMVNVYSTTKGVTAICAHRLIDEGHLELDAPVARYWPEFAQAGKAEIPVRWLLSHRSGLPAVREPLPGEALYSWGAMTAALAAQEPWWTPGTRHGYQAVTFGWLVGEVIRRVSGKSVGRYFHDEIGKPLGVDFHIGTDDHEHGRIAEMSQLSAEPSPDGASLMEVILSDPKGVTAMAFLNPSSLALGVNHAEWRRAEIPGANGHGTARALARLYGVLARGGSQAGVHLLSDDALARCHAEQSQGEDLVLRVPTRFGQGFMLSQRGVKGATMGPSARTFGHPGAGGSLAFADPERRIGFAYVMNRMGPHILMDPRATALVDAVYASL